MSYQLASMHREKLSETLWHTLCRCTANVVESIDGLVRSRSASIDHADRQNKTVITQQVQWDESKAQAFIRMVRRMGL
jgi:hypothetical protein